MGKLLWNGSDLDDDEIIVEIFLALLVSVLKSRSVSSHNQWKIDDTNSLRMS